MSKSRKCYWFPAKRYGWGWGFPCAWQGWVVFAVFIAVVSLLPLVIDPADDLLLFSAVIVGSTGILIGICHAKGEPPKWRWGNSGSDDDSSDEDPVSKRDR